MEERSLEEGERQKQEGLLILSSPLFITANKPFSPKPPSNPFFSVPAAFIYLRWELFPFVLTVSLPFQWLPFIPSHFFLISAIHPFLLCYTLQPTATPFASKCSLHILLLPFSINCPILVPVSHLYLSHSIFSCNHFAVASISWLCPTPHHCGSCPVCMYLHVHPLIP